MLSGGRAAEPERYIGRGKPSPLAAFFLRHVLQKYAARPVLLFHRRSGVSSGAEGASAGAMFDAMPFRRSERRAARALQMREALLFGGMRRHGQAAVRRERVFSSGCGRRLSGERIFFRRSVRGRVVSTWQSAEGKRKGAERKTTCRNVCGKVPEDDGRNPGEPFRKRYGRRERSSGCFPETAGRDGTAGRRCARCGSTGWGSLPEGKFHGEDRCPAHAAR